MKRTLLICILVIVVSLSFAAHAKNETLLEEHWENYMDTTELKYSAEEGKIELGLGYSEVLERLRYDLSGDYGINDQIQSHGYVSGASSFQDGDNSTDLWFGGNVKAKLYERNSFVVAALAGVEYNDDLSYDLNLYTDFDLSENLTIHNNLLFCIDESDVSKRLYNGVDYRYNQQHALRAYLYTNFTDFDALTNKIKLMYKNDFNQQINFLSSIEKTFQRDNLLFRNLVEVELIDDLLLTGYYDFNTESEDNMVLDLRKDFLDLTVGAGYEYNTGEVSTLYGNLAYDLQEDIEMELELKCSDSSISVETGVAYSF